MVGAGNAVFTTSALVSVWADADPPKLAAFAETGFGFPVCDVGTRCLNVHRYQTMPTHRTVSSAVTAVTATPNST